MSGFETVLLVLALIVLGVPVSYSMLGASLLYGMLAGIPIGSMVMRAANSVNSATLLAIPAFIFASTLMNHGGVTLRIFEFVNKSRIGAWRGGLAQVNVLASLIFSGMSGAALADIGGLGKVEIKAMHEAGYKLKDATAVTMASSIIGPIFPPSIPLLLYAVVAQVSGLEMLMSGIVPGILITLFLMFQVAYIARRNNWPTTVHDMTGAEKWRVFWRAFPALLMPLLLVVGLLSGWYSPIELACLTVFYAFFLSAILYRDLTLRSFAATVREAVASASGILFIAASASLFAWVITFEGVAELARLYLTDFTENKYVLLLIAVVVLLVWGMVMDMLAALLIFTPILLPAAIELGVHPVQFGVVMCFTLILGLYTPPVGVCLFLGTQITGIPALKIFQAMLPYYLPILAALAAVVLIPELTTFVPELIMGR